MASYEGSVACYGCFAACYCEARACYCEARALAKTPRFGGFISGTFLGVSPSAELADRRGESTTMGVLLTPVEGDRGSIARA